MRRHDAFALAAGAAVLIAAASGGRTLADAPSVPEPVREVFRSHCAGCHKGAFAPKRLKLDAEAVPASVVSVASQEKPDLMLVAPGAPEASYLIMKVKGSEGISGKPMPPAGRTPLTDEEIVLLEEWIKGLE